MKKTYKKGNYEISFKLTNNALHGYIDNVTNYNRVITFTVYDNKKVAYDFPEQLPKYIKQYTEQLAKKIEF